MTDTNQHKKPRPGNELVVRLEQALSERRSQLAELLPPGIRPERLMQSIRLAMWRNPDLQRCSLASLVDSARDKGPVAKLIIGARGIVAIASRNGFMVDANVVVENDAFTYRLGTSPLLEHQPALDRPRGAVVGDSKPARRWGAAASRAAARQARRHQGPRTVG